MDLVIANTRVQNQGMNLSDIPERPERPDTRLADYQRAWWERMQREIRRNGPLLPNPAYQQAWDPGITPRNVAFYRDTRVAWNDQMTAGPDARINYDVLPEHEAILRRLHEEWLWLQRAGWERDRRDLPDVALRITAPEWNTVLRWLPRETLQANFGPEGALLNFRGVPLHVIGR